MRTLKLLASMAFAAIACSPVQTSQNGITVKTGNGDKVRIEVVTDQIIHVCAVPGKARFTDGKSLMAVPYQCSGTFTVSKNDSTVIVSTSKLNVIVDKAVGAVKYTDPEGNVITSEHSREFAPIEVEGTKAWTVHQVFDSPDDEAFYGLGQHQADEWNYKGRNEELYQYNTKISVPFIVSSRRYGILWDSNSFCRWGDPREYASIGDVFTLYDKDGVEGALTGTYTPANGAALVRRETALEQEFLITPKCEKVRNAPDFNFYGSSVIFEGEIEPSQSGLFHFYIYYAGYTKVFLDGKAVTPEIWRTAWNPNGRKFEANLEAGKRVPLRIEWAPDGGVSYCALRVLSPVDPQQQGRMSWWGEMQDQIDYYFIDGEDIDEVIKGYRTITGKAQIMPKWVMGYWQSRERYRNSDEIVSTLSEFRRRGIPVDNIVLDWQYWKDDQWGSHAFDEARFPDPKGMVDSVHALDGRFMISVWPKFYTGTEHYDELDANGWIYQTAIRDTVRDWLGYMQSFYDAYAPGARKMFWDQMYKTLYPIGVDAWWMDASEPNIHDCTDMDYRKAMCGPTALGPSTQYFNAYALMNAQAIYEGQRSVDNRRVFLLTRNGFAGLQRYSTASWSGDIGTRWEDMKAQISAGLNYSISGIPFWGQDVGGFSVENRFVAAQQLFDYTGKVSEDLKEWRELNARWHEWGIFCPLYRAHGQWPLREPWNIAPEGDPAYQAIVDADNLRYRLLPYIYSLAARVHFDDYTMMRPLVMDFTDDMTARNISDEFLFGDAFLVCPVYEYKARSREVYLPEGTWYDFNDNYKPVQGGRAINAPAPYGQIPIYVREGQIVPTGPAVQNTAHTEGCNIIFRVFAGKDAEFCLYEDDGLTYDYENGEYTRIPVSWDEAGKTLTIGAREGAFEEMVTERHFLVNLIGDGVNILSEPITYTGEPVTINF